eukprot:CAMPEP_0182418606 /NCGR_PEP_ID=MMETSP1167-20130531/2990_1 /TAXON_ID=2988 /ORGANISM="Mallomonas Sp, Strain CCMP3275" /LENGTH=193 /DNA_ID=CAMNT_0024592885 /DNA_START=1557 /DNA_END=2138 /DNA_ORIENTATION=-
MRMHSTGSSSETIYELKRRYCILDQNSSELVYYHASNPQKEKGRIPIDPDKTRLVTPLFRAREQLKGLDMEFQSLHQQGLEETKKNNLRTNSPVGAELDTEINIGSSVEEGWFALITGEQAVVLRTDSHRENEHWLRGIRIRLCRPSAYGMMESLYSADTAVATEPGMQVVASSSNDAITDSPNDVVDHVIDL